MIIRSTLAAIAFGTIVIACAADPEEQGGTSQGVEKTEPKKGSSSGSGESKGGAFKDCCGGRGSCVPKAAVSSSQQENLDSCDGGEDLLCAPKEFVKDQKYKGPACKSNVTLGSSKIPYDGVCLSDCLNIPSEDILGRDGCKDSEICVPCKHPATGEPTNAPGCE